MVKEMNIEELKKVEPTLTEYGIEWPRTYHSKSLPQEKEVKLCKEWLKPRNCKIIKSAGVSSVNIKQAIEKELRTYIANGAVIAAIIELGIPYEKVDDSIFIWTYLSQTVLPKRDRYDQWGQQVIKPEHNEKLIEDSVDPEHMLIPGRYSGRYTRTAIVMHNLLSVQDGLNSINDFAVIYGRLKNYDGYFVTEFSENDKYLGVLFSSKGYIVERVHFNISNISKSNNLKTPWIKEIIYMKI